MALRMQIHLPILHPHPLQRLLTRPRTRRRHPKQPQYARPLHAPKPRLPAHRVLRGNPPLPIRGPRQRQHHPRARHHVLRLHDVAHREHVRIRRPHALVDLDGAAGAHLEAGGGREGGLGLHAEAEDGEVRVEGGAGVDGDADAVAAVEGLEARDLRGQHEVDAVLAELGLDEDCELRVVGGHDVVGALDEGDGEAAVDEVFRGFEADEAAADDDGGVFSGVEPRADRAGVRDGFEDEDGGGRGDARDRRGRGGGGGGGGYVGVVGGAEEEAEEEDEGEGESGGGAGGGGLGAEEGVRGGEEDPRGAGEDARGGGGAAA
mmetsp:Transcript_14898/g.38039  ORF Transcript_14898/g.38039 Transcript_14898/m.38039 type:complete len:319 (+) Transcript_14898:956-1912(+)